MANTWPLRDSAHGYMSGVSSLRTFDRTGRFSTGRYVDPNSTLGRLEAAKKAKAEAAGPPKLSSDQQFERIQAKRRRNQRKRARKKAKKIQAQQKE